MLRPVTGLVAQIWKYIKSFSQFSPGSYPASRIALLELYPNILSYQKCKQGQSKQPIFVAFGDAGSFIGYSGRDANGVIPPDLQPEDCHHNLLLGCIQPSNLDTPPSIGVTGDDEQKDSEVLETPRKAMLGLFAVSPAYQSHGIGKALLNYALDYMRSTWHTSICVITVIEVRQEIIRWYEKQGFTWDGVTMKTFSSPELAKSEFKFRVMEKIIRGTRQ